MYFDCNTGEVLDDKINEKIDEFISFISSNGINHEKMFNEFNDKFKDKFYSEYKFYLCGKYLLYGLYLHLIYICNKNGFKKNIDKKMMIKILCSNIDKNSIDRIYKRFLPYVKNAI